MLTHGVLLLTNGQVTGGVIGVAAGGLLLAGLFTTHLAFLAGAFCACVLASVLPGAPLFESRVAAFLAVAVGFSLALAGPGAFSADARLFGPREIVIPPGTGFRDSDDRGE